MKPEELKIAKDRISRAEDEQRIIERLGTAIESLASNETVALQLNLSPLASESTVLYSDDGDSRQQERSFKAVCWTRGNGDLAGKIRAAVVKILEDLRSEASERLEKI